MSIKRKFGQSWEFIEMCYSDEFSLEGGLYIIIRASGSINAENRTYQHNHRRLLDRQEGLHSELRPHADSHAHRYCLSDSDHLKGLYDGWSYGPIYCHRLTAELLRLRFPSLKDVVREYLCSVRWSTTNRSKLKCHPILN